jgi:quercetin dioxygenase-like cupin family protein
MTSIGLAGLAVVAAAAVAAAPGPAPDLSTLNPAALKALVPSKINWVKAEGLAGTDTAVLVGDPAKPGFYVVLNRFHPGAFSHPHYHLNDRYIMVLSGTWWVNTGLDWDPEHKTVPLKPGTFVIHAGRQVHYDGDRMGGEDAVVMIFGQGPGTRFDCDGPAAQTGPGPCADARAAAAR